MWGGMIKDIQNIGEDLKNMGESAAKGGFSLDARPELASLGA